MGFIARHILPKEFYRDMNLFFQGMGQRTIDYHATVNGIQTLLEHAVDDGKVIANHPISQEIVEQAHDELLKIIDDRIFCILHLVKINEFIPHLINKFGSKIRYEDPDTALKTLPCGEWDNNIYCRFDFEQASEVKKHNNLTRVNFWEINLPVYCDEDSLWRDFEKLLTNGYTQINSLRALMTPETIKNRESNIHRDSFCSEFLYGKETGVADAASRAEYQYFIKNGFSLGVLKTSSKVAKWLATERRKPSRYERTFDYLRKLDTAVILPAIYYIPDSKGHPTSDMVRQFARNTCGIIPEGGIIFGSNEKPKQSKLDLVH